MPIVLRVSAALIRLAVAVGIACGPARADTPPIITGDSPDLPYPDASKCDPAPPLALTFSLGDTAPLVGEAVAREQLQSWRNRLAGGDSIIMVQGRSRSDEPAGFLASAQARVALIRSMLLDLGFQDTDIWVQTVMVSPSRSAHDDLGGVGISALSRKQDCQTALAASRFRWFWRHCLVTSDVSPDPPNNDEQTTCTLAQQQLRGKLSQ